VRSTRSPRPRATRPPLANAKGIDTRDFAIDGDGVHWIRTARRARPNPWLLSRQPVFDATTPGPQSLDPRYGRCGSIAPVATTFRSSIGQALGRGADGSVAVAGVAGVAFNADRLAVVKLTAAGASDPTWGDHAVVVKPPLPAGSQGLVVEGVGVEPGGAVVVAATYADQGFKTTRSLLARFDASGHLDPGFGSGGYVLDALPGQSVRTIDDIAVQPDGAIVAGGETNDTDTSFGDAGRFTVARFTPAGSLDPSFAGDGIAMLDTASLGRGHADAVRVLGDGRILAAGGAGQGFALARFAVDGTPDPAFGTGGAVYDSPPADAAITALDLTPDGHIVMAGSGGTAFAQPELALRCASAPTASPTRRSAAGASCSTRSPAPRPG